jgi:tetrahydromethanopterin S-methyltransferase subunit A
MLDYDDEIDKSKTKQVINFSIEGSRLLTDESIVKACIARKVAITTTPCNKSCVGERVKEPEKDDPVSKLNKLFGKSEVPCEILKKAEKGFKKDIFDNGTLSMKGKDLKLKKLRKLSMSNVRKALTAGCAVGAPSTLEGGAALQKENIDKKRHIITRKELRDKLKKISDDSYSRFTKKEELQNFLKSEFPERNDKEILMLAKIVSYIHEKKAEMKLKEMMKE